MILGISGKAGSGKDAAAAVLVRDFGFVRVAFADELKRVAKRLFGWDDDRLWGPSERRNEPDPAWQREHGPFTRDRRCACCGAQAEVDDTLAYVLFVPRSAGPCCLTARFALQHLGTEAGRALHPDVWVRATMRWIDRETRLRGLNMCVLERCFIHDGEACAMGHMSREQCPNGLASLPRFVVPDVRFRNEAEAIRAAGGSVLRVVRPGAGLEGAAGEHASETELTDGDGLYDFRIANGGTLAEFEAKVTRLGRVLTWSGPRDLKPAPDESPLTVGEALRLPIDHDKVCVVCLGSGRGAVVHSEACPYGRAGVARPPTLGEQDSDIDEVDS